MRKDCHVTAAFQQFASYVVFIAVVYKSYPVFCILCPVLLGSLDADLRNNVSDAVSSYFFKALFLVEVRLIGYHSVHYAAFTDDARKAAGVDIVQPYDPVLFEKVIYVILASEIGRLLTVLADYVAADDTPAAFIVLAVHTVVTDKREGLSYYLSAVARVGERFLISDHRGSENCLTDDRSLRTEGLALKDSPVREDKVCFFAACKLHFTAPFCSSHLFRSV